jgi:integrase
LPTVIVRRSFAQLEMRLVSTAGNGLPVNVVQRAMGHQQASTTLNRYTHAPADYDDRVRAAWTPPLTFR